MSDNLVITIGRHCGSKGNIIGRQLAEKMGAQVYHFSGSMILPRQG